MRSADSIAIIINPAAKSVRATQQVEKVRAMAPGATLLLTQAAGDARRLARDLANSGCPVVVAAGGDGTVNEVVAGLLESTAPAPPALGLLPLGTMNVFALELGLPVRQIQDCWNRILSGPTREIDAWLAGTHPFVQMAGVGLDATVIQQTSWQSKKKWGPLSYVNSLARVLDQPAGQLRLSVDQGPWLDGTTALFGNGRFYGGPFPVFPNARPDDGLIDILLVHGHGPATFCKLLADVLTRSIDDHQESVTRLQGRHIRIEAPVPVPCEIDGELGDHSPLVITRHDRRLRVIA
jgi:YegS/Rv2252/BmrU family lipid kinase